MSSEKSDFEIDHWQRTSRSPCRGGGLDVRPNILLFVGKIIIKNSPKSRQTENNNKK